MLAARVLAEYFQRVTVIERDSLPGEPSARAGVPQGKHLHVLLPRGVMVLEDLFLELLAELQSAGAVPIDIGNDIAWLTPQGWGARFQAGRRILAFSRELLDWSVTVRLVHLSNIELWEECDVVGLIDTNGSVNGLRARARGRGGERNINADLIVLAPGRHAAVNNWLSAVGISAPQTTVIDAHVGYASRYYRRSPHFGAHWKAIFIQAAPPHHVRGGGLFPLEKDRWIATLQGGDRDYPPTDDVGFLEFTRSLRSPLMYEAIRDAEPLTDIVGYRATQNVFRHYEQLAQWPDRLLVIGDSVCSLNPVYAQGITVAALACMALRDLLKAESLDGLGKRFQRRAARIASGPWMLSTTEDLRFRNVEGAKPGVATRCLHHYVDELLRTANMNEKVRRSFLDVQGMLAGAHRIFAPSVVTRIVANAVRRQLQATR